MKVRILYKNVLSQQCELTFRVRCIWMPTNDPLWYAWHWTLNVDITFSNVCTNGLSLCEKPSSITVCKDCIWVPVVHYTTSVHDFYYSFMFLAAICWPFCVPVKTSYMGLSEGGVGRNIEKRTLTCSSLSIYDLALSKFYCIWFRSYVAPAPLLWRATLKSSLVHASSRRFMSRKKIPKLMCYKPGGQTYGYGHVHVYVLFGWKVHLYLLVLEAWLERRGCQSHC